MLKKNLRKIVSYLWHLPGTQLFVPDKLYLMKQYKNFMGRDLNLDNPLSFNEKLQWLKLNDRRSEYTSLVDKFEVRKYVSDLIGEKYLIPMLGIFNSYDEINFKSLPNQFVLKPTHTSGDVYICKDKSKIDYIRLKKEIDKWLKKNYYWVHREWPYKNVKPRIICENFMVDESGTELKDYKFFCFNGEPKALFVATDRGIDTRFDFFDINFNRIPITKNHYLNANKEIIKPANFNKMVELAKILSKKFPHVRVDFYNINGNIYFGELTFYHFSGLEKFEPEIYDEIFGSWLKLPGR